MVIFRSNVNIATEGTISVKVYEISIGISSRKDPVGHSNIRVAANDSNEALRVFMDYSSRKIPNHIKPGERAKYFIMGPVGPEVNGDPRVVLVGAFRSYSTLDELLAEGAF